MSLDAELDEVILAAVNAGVARVNTSVPCVVTKYDRAAQTVQVKFACWAGESRPKAERADIPVAFPAGGGFRVIWPIEPGDEGVIEAHKFDPAAFRESGSPRRADTVRLHGEFWTFRPSNESAKKAWADAPANAMILGGPIEIEISDEIKLGRAAEDYVALAAKVNANFQQIKDLFTEWVVVSNDGGAALKALAADLDFEDVDAEKVQAE